MTRASRFLTGFPNRPCPWQMTVPMTARCVGVETVKTHVRNVLAKLGARDRVQAVITSYESGSVSAEDRPGTAGHPPDAPIRRALSISGHGLVGNRN